MDSNLNLDSPFIILQIRHWNSPAAVTCIHYCPNMHNSAVKCGDPQTETFPTHDSKASLCGDHCR
eukprot:scaffold119010_cov81-Cyclotella_meneghiniana.AAC.1